jgi:hypothetical protein
MEVPIGGIGKKEKTMRYFSTTDLDQKTPREQAALYNDVFKALGQARQDLRKGEGTLEHIRKAKARKNMRPNP